MTGREELPRSALGLVLGFQGLLGFVAERAHCRSSLRAAAGSGFQAACAEAVEQQAASADAVNAAAAAARGMQALQCLLGRRRLFRSPTTSSPLNKRFYN
jgi:hypothetical protein